LNELVEANQLRTLEAGVRPTNGMHIVAQFNEDEMWYRAEVTKVCNDLISAGMIQRSFAHFP